MQPGTTAIRVDSVRLRRSNAVACIPALPGHDDPAMEYCRRARSIRQRHRNDVPRMHQELRTLAGVIEPTPGVTHRFADLVGQALEDGVLRWSRRQMLIKAAQGMGLSECEAALIIATVQENHSAVSLARKGPGATKLLAAAAAMQGVIAAGVWWLVG